MDKEIRWKLTLELNPVDIFNDSCEHRISKVEMLSGSYSPFTSKTIP